jgi:hypothetical protein
MAISETARLIASLELKDLFTKSVDNATKSMGKLDKQITGTQGRAYKAGQQIGVGIKRGVILATSALTGLAGLLLLSAKEGQHAADVQVVYANAIARSGKITAAYVTQLNAQSLALSNLTGMDDEQIKSEQTRLIQMKLSGKQILTLLPLILDAAKSTGRDLDSVTLAVGRAAQGSATSLGRLGIIIPKTAKKSKDAFGDVVKALKAFQGTNAALSGSLEVKLKVFQERLQDIREEAGIKLLPALTRITDTVTKSLLPAFQSFIDSILPSVIEGLNKFADFLSSGQGAKSLSSVFNTIKTAAPIIQRTAEATFTIVKAAVDLFTSLPEGLQQLAVGAFAVNKLTGGLVTNIGGGIADFVAGKIGLLRGQTPATPLYVSDVTRGLGDAAGVAGGAVKAAGVGSDLATLGKGAVRLAGGIGVMILAFDALAAVANATSTAQQRATTEQNVINDQRNKRTFGGIIAPKGSASDPIHVTAPGLKNPILDRGGREPGRENFITTVGGFDKRFATAVLQAFSRMITALKTAKTDPEIKRALHEAVRQVIGLKKGSLDATKQTIAGLKTALKNTNDPKLQKEIRSALAKVQAKIPGREFAQRAINIANAAFHDGKLTLAEQRRLKTITQQLKDRGLPHAAKGIEDRVNAAKKGITGAVAGTTAAIGALKLDPTILVRNNISIRELANGSAIVTNYSDSNLRSGSRG